MMAWNFFDWNWFKGNASGLILTPFISFPTSCLTALLTAPFGSFSSLCYTGWTLKKMKEFITHLQ